MLKFNRFLTEKNKAFMKKVTNLRESIDILQNVINDFMKSIFIVHENLVASTLTSSIIINFSDDENMYNDISDEDTIDEKSDN